MIGPPLGVWADAALAAMSMIAIAASAWRFPGLVVRVPRWCLVTLALFTASAALATAREHAREDHPLAQLALGASMKGEEQGDLLVTVWTTDDPRPVRGNRVLIPGELRSPWSGASVVVLAPRRPYETLAPWQTVTFVAKAAPP